MIESPRENDYGDLVRHEMPSGAVVFYRDRDHSYWGEAKEKTPGCWGGSKRLTGVSTCAAPLDFRPDNLMKWAAHLNGNGVAVLAADGLSLDDADDIRSSLRWLSSADTIWHALEDAKLLFSDYRDERGRSGTNVHEHALHALAAGKPVPARDLLTVEEWGYARGMMAFWHECEPEPLQSEQVVVSSTHGFAGRLDLRCRINGATWLIDGKTSGFIPAKHHGQLAGYDLAAIESGFGQADRLAILQVTADGEYELIDGQATHEDFLGALSVYRAASRINTACRSSRKAAQPVVTA
jgi:hypothetical protein